MSLQPPAPSGTSEWRPARVRRWGPAGARSRWGAAAGAERGLQEQGWQPGGHSDKAAWSSWMAPWCRQAPCAAANPRETHRECSPGRCKGTASGLTASGTERLRSPPSAACPSPGMSANHTKSWGPSGARTTGPASPDSAEEGKESKSTLGNAFRHLGPRISWSARPCEGPKRLLSPGTLKCPSPRGPSLLPLSLSLPGAVGEGAVLGAPQAAAVGTQRSCKRTAPGP